MSFVVHFCCRTLKEKISIFLRYKFLKDVFCCAFLLSNAERKYLYFYAMNVSKMSFVVRFCCRTLKEKISIFLRYKFLKDVFCCAFLLSNAERKNIYIFTL